MHVPLSLSVSFVLITITTIFIFYLASHKNLKTVFVVLAYAIIQGLLAYTNFYSVQPLVPAKIPLVVAPSFILIFYLIISRSSVKYIQSFKLKTLTLLHTIRIPVELVLFLLFTHSAIPEIMTFEGRNFDILAGITAPIIYYLAFVKNIIKRKGLLIWNIVCLALLINIIVHAILSIEIPIQQFGFDQPNRAFLYIPFIWLPSVVVPLVFFSHLIAMKRLWTMKSN